MLSTAFVFACLARAALAAPLALDAADLSAPRLFVAGGLPGTHHRGGKLNMTIADMEARIVYLEARAEEKFKVESGPAYSVRVRPSFRPLSRSDDPGDQGQADQAPRRRRGRAAAHGDGRLLGARSDRDR